MPTEGQTYRVSYRTPGSWYRVTIEVYTSSMLRDGNPLAAGELCCIEVKANRRNYYRDFDGPPPPPTAAKPFTNADGTTTPFVRFAENDPVLIALAKAAVVAFGDGLFAVVDRVQELERENPLSPGSRVTFYKAIRTLDPKSVTCYRNGERLVPGVLTPPSPTSPGPPT